MTYKGQYKNARADNRRFTSLKRMSRNVTLYLNEETYQATQKLLLWHDFIELAKHMTASVDQNAPHHELIDLAVHLGQAFYLAQHHVPNFPPEVNEAVYALRCALVRRYL